MGRDAGGLCAGASCSLPLAPRSLLFPPCSLLFAARSLLLEPCSFLPTVKLTQNLLRAPAQMVTQFGYLALFAPACSLAPLLAFINNVTEIRTDAWKVCNLFQRPMVKPMQSIGAFINCSLSGHVSFTCRSPASLVFHFCSRVSIFVHVLFTERSISGHFSFTSRSDLSLSHHRCLG